MHVARYYFKPVILYLCCIYYEYNMYAYNFGASRRCRGPQWPPVCAGIPPFMFAASSPLAYYTRIYTHIVSTLKPEFRATAKFNMVTVRRSPKTLFAVTLPHTRPPAIPLSKYNNPSAPVHGSVFALIQYFLASPWTRV